MGTKYTWVKLHHDEGYGKGEDLLWYINKKLQGSDMRAVGVQDPHKENPDPSDPVVTTRRFIDNCVEDSLVRQELMQKLGIMREAAAKASVILRTIGYWGAADELDRAGNKTEFTDRHAELNDE